MEKNIDGLPPPPRKHLPTISHIFKHSAWEWCSGGIIRFEICYPHPYKCAPVHLLYASNRHGARLNNLLSFVRTDSMRLSRIPFLLSVKAMNIIDVTKHLIRYYKSYRVWEPINWLGYCYSFLATQCLMCEHYTAVLINDSGLIQDHSWSIFRLEPIHKLILSSI